TELLTYFCEKILDQLGSRTFPLQRLKQLCVVKANERDWQHGYIKNSRTFGRVTCNPEAVGATGEDDGEIAGYARICCGGRDQWKWNTPDGRAGQPGRKGSS